MGIEAEVHLLRTRLAELETEVSVVKKKDKADLRDRFAMVALAGLICPDDIDEDPTPVARSAYDYADAMLRERARDSYQQWDEDQK